MKSEDMCCFPSVLFLYLFLIHREGEDEIRGLVLLSFGSLPVPRPDTVRVLSVPASRSDDEGEEGCFSFDYYTCPHTDLEKTAGATGQRVFLSLKNSLKLT